MGKVKVEVVVVGLTETVKDAFNERLAVEARKGVNNETCIRYDNRMSDDVGRGRG